MPESNILGTARRTGVLDGVAPTPAGRRVAVNVLSPAARFVLRASGEVAAGTGTASGFDLTMPINRHAAGDHDRTAVRLGPDEWLLIGAEGDLAAIEGALSAALAGTHHTVVDISHRNIALEVRGPAAASVLNAGCPLDLDGDRFPVGSATRTLLGKAEIVLLRLADRDGAACYRVECWRSFGRYAHAFLAEAALEFSARA